MTDAQIFQMLGLVFVVVGVSWVINHGAYRRLVKDMAKSESVLLLMGMITLVTGYVLLVLHDTDSLLIKILGWITLLKGVTIIFFQAFGDVYAFLNGMKRYFSFMPWVILIFGIVCAYLGYTA